MIDRAQHLLAPLLVALGCGAVDSGLQSVKQLSVHLVKVLLETNKHALDQFRFA